MTTNGANGQLTVALARELGEAVRTIAGQADLLLERLPQDDALRQPARSIRETADRAGTALGRLFSASQAGSFKPLDLELNAVVRQMQMPLQRLVGDSIRLDLDLDPAVDLGLVKADPAQIQRAILNVVLNARDAMPDGGQVTIETSGSFEGSHGQVVLTVRDNGCGMDTATRARVMRPFFSTKGVGRGLGLFVVQGIVDQCGGRIQVESEPERGTTVHLHLPAVRDASVGSTDATRSTSVLVVVEDEDLRQVLVAMLDVGGFPVLSAATGRDALRLLAHPNSVCLLVTETALRDMSGRELSRRVGEAHPETKVLFLSGYAEEAWLRAQKFPFLSLPLSSDAFLRGVRQALAAPAALSPR